MRHLVLLFAAASLLACADDTGVASTADAASDDAASGDAANGDDDAQTTADDTAGDTDLDPDTGGEPQFECPPATGERPPALSEHAYVFDPVKERLVIFGGNPAFPVSCQAKNSFLAETWAYWPRCDVWERLPEGPSARGRASAVYDPVAHAMVMFGGRFRAEGADGFSPYTLYNETWRLDLTTDTWTQVSTSGLTPAARVNASAVYDPVGHRLVLFGGNTSTGGASYSPLNDTHALDLATGEWFPLQDVGPPPARLFAAAVYDSASHAMVITQGGDANAFIGPFLGDTWQLDLTTLAWTQLHPGLTQAPAPEHRIWGRALYNPVIDQVVLFGGHDDGDLGNRNDLWLFDTDARTWGRLTEGDVHNKPANGVCDFPPDFALIAEGTPERRGSHAVVYWEAEDAMLIYGGKTDCGLIDDVWQYDFPTAQWTDLSPATVGEACLRFSDASQCTSHCL